MALFSDRKPGFPGERKLLLTSRVQWRMFCRSIFCLFPQPFELVAVHKILPRKMPQSSPHHHGCRSFRQSSGYHSCWCINTMAPLLPWLPWNAQPVVRAYHPGHQLRKMYAFLPSLPPFCSTSVKFPFFMLVPTYNEAN